MAAPSTSKVPAARCSAKRIPAGKRRVICSLEAIVAERVPRRWWSGGRGTEADGQGLASGNQSKRALRTVATSVPSTSPLRSVPRRTVAPAATAMRPRKDV